MRLAYLLFFLPSLALAQPKARVEVLPNPQSLEDFDHLFKGCPENSECDQIMGHRLDQWKRLTSKLKDSEMPSAKKAEYLEVFRNKYGVPVEFYTYKKSQQGFKPLYFTSPCKSHQSKDENQKVLKGMAFLKSLNKDNAIVWRDQTQIEVPNGELLIPQTVQVQSEKGYESYYLPLGDQPLFIKNKDLFVLREEDGFFYTLRVSPNGDWKITDLDYANLSSWEMKRENVECPKDLPKGNPIFEMPFCKTVWNEDQKKTVIVKMEQGCSI